MEELIKYRAYTLSEMYKLKSYIESQGHICINLKDGEHDSRNLLTTWTPSSTLDKYALANTSKMSTDIFDVQYYEYHNGNL